MKPHNKNSILKRDGAEGERDRANKEKRDSGREEERAGRTKDTKKYKGTLWSDNRLSVWVYG